MSCSLPPCIPLPTHSPASCANRSRAGFLSWAFLSGCPCATSAPTDSPSTSDPTILLFMACTSASLGVVEDLGRDDRRKSGSRMGLLERANIELLHRQHRLHDPRGFFGVRIAEQLGQHGRNDLPGQSELVLEPAAFHLAAPRGEFAPV